MVSTARIIALFCAASCVFVLTAGSASLAAGRPVAKGIVEDAAVPMHFKLGPTLQQEPTEIEESQLAERDDNGAVPKLLRMMKQSLSLESLEKTVSERMSRKNLKATKRRRAKNRRRRRRRNMRESEEPTMPSPELDLGPQLPISTFEFPVEGEDLPPPFELPEESRAPKGEDLPPPFEFPEESEAPEGEMMPEESGMPVETVEPVDLTPPVIMVKQMRLALARAPGSRASRARGASYKIYVLQGSNVRHYRVRFNFRRPAQAIQGPPALLGIDAPPAQAATVRPDDVRKQIRKCIKRRYKKKCIRKPERKKPKCSDRIVKKCVIRFGGDVTFFKETKKPDRKEFLASPSKGALPTDEPVPTVEDDLSEF